MRLKTVLNMAFHPPSLPFFFAVQKAITPLPSVLYLAKVFLPSLSFFYSAPNLEMPLPDLDQDFAPIPRSREENQERYVRYNVWQMSTLTMLQSLYFCFAAKRPEPRFPAEIRQSGFDAA